MVDVAALSQTVQTLSQLPNITPNMRRIVLKAAMRIVLEVGGVGDDDYERIVEEIEGIPDDDLRPSLSIPGFGGGGFEHPADGEDE